MDREIYKKINSVDSHPVDKSAAILASRYTYNERRHDITSEIY